MIVIPNRARVVVAMVSALAVAAGLLTLALLAKPAPARAETITDTDRSSFTFTGGCTELAVIEGTLRTVAHTTTDANGGFHTKFNFKLQGQGRGADSGDKYVLNWQGGANQNFPAGADSTVTLRETFKIIRQGSATSTDDLHVKGLIHVTINAQGEVTAEVRKLEEVCT